MFRRKFFEIFIENVYGSMPKSKKIDTIKNDAVSLCLQKFEELKKEGMSDNEAVSHIIKEYGTEHKLREILNYEIDENMLISKEEIEKHISKTRKKLRLTA